MGNWEVVDGLGRPSRLYYARVTGFGLGIGKWHLGFRLKGSGSKVQGVSLVLWASSCGWPGEESSEPEARSIQPETLSPEL